MYVCITSCCLPTGCSSGLSPETKGVYVLFFLLSCFILMPLVVVGILYHRHHRGTFLVRCHSSSTSSPDLSNDNHHHDDNYSYPAESDLPPPLPPTRGPRGGWPQGKEHRPAVDVPLLRFSSLLPRASYVESQESGKLWHFCIWTTLFQSECQILLSTVQSVQLKSHQNSISMFTWHLYLCLWTEEDTYRSSIKLHGHKH